jgi:hypothetical protein
MAQLTGEDLKQFNKDLKELNRLRKDIDKEPLKITADSSQIEAVKNELESIRDIISNLDESVEGLSTQWRRVLGEVSATNQEQKLGISSLNKLKDISDKIRLSQKGISELSSRELRSLSNKSKIEFENLQLSYKMLKAKENLLEVESDEYKLLKEMEDQIKNNTSSYNRQLDTISLMAKQQQNIERATGLTGAALKGVSGFLNKIGMSDMGGVFEDAAEAAKSTANRLTDGGKKAGGFITKIKAMGSAFKVVGKEILRNLTDPLIVAGLAMKAMKGIFGFFSEAYKKGEEAAARISDENTGIARSLGLAQGAASRLAGSVAGMGPTTAASKASIEGIYKAMGSTEKLSRNTLSVFVKLNTFAGMSAESLAKFQKFAKKGGEDAGTMVKNMANTALQAVKNNKLALSQKELLEETANQSSYVKLQFAGQGPALVKAVAQSRALGVNMEKARNMARSLLNFEDSIAAEMEAELMTGKQLNLEEARALALKGDNVGAAKLIAEQVGGAAEFMSMNVLQQEALAKAAGLGVDEMTDMLSGQQDMKKSGADLVKDQTNGIKAMSSAVSVREGMENRARAAAEANISVYRELNSLVNTLKATWTEIQTILTNALTDLVLQPLVDFINSKEGQDFLKELPGRVQSAVDGIKDFAREVKKFATDHPWIVKALGGLAVGAIAINLGKNALSFFGIGKHDGSSPMSAMYVRM